MNTTTNKQSLKGISGTLATVTSWEPAPAATPLTIDSSVYEIDVWGSDELGNEYQALGLYAKSGELMNVDLVRISHYVTIAPDIYEEMTEGLDEYELISLNEARGII